MVFKKILVSLHKLSEKYDVMVTSKTRYNIFVNNFVKHDPKGNPRLDTDNTGTVLSSKMVI